MRLDCVLSIVSYVIFLLFVVVGPIVIGLVSLMDGGLGVGCAMGVCSGWSGFVFWMVVDMLMNTLVHDK